MQVEFTRIRSRNHTVRLGDMHHHIIPGKLYPPEQPRRGRSIQSLFLRSFEGLIGKEGGVVQGRRRPEVGPSEKLNKRIRPLAAGYAILALLASTTVIHSYINAPDLLGIV